VGSLTLPTSPSVFCGFLWFYFVVLSVVLFCGFILWVYFLVLFVVSFCGFICSFLLRVYSGVLFVVLFRGFILWSQPALARPVPPSSVASGTLVVPETADCRLDGEPAPGHVLHAASAGFASLVCVFD